MGSKMPSDDLTPTMGYNYLLEGYDFDEQYGDVVLDAILQPAPRAAKVFLLLGMLQIAAALRADENLEEGRIERHGQAFRDGTG